MVLDALAEFGMLSGASFSLPRVRFHNSIKSQFVSTATPSSTSTVLHVVSTSSLAVPMASQGSESTASSMRSICCIRYSASRFEAIVCS